MKTPALDLAPVTAGREALASAEAHLVAMRERLEVARQLVDTRQAEQREAEEARRTAVIAGMDDEPAVRELVNARIRAEDAREKVGLLNDAVRQAEDEVIAAENALLLTLDAARLARYEATKAELVAAILKAGPPFRAAAIGVGQSWWTVGMMMSDLGQRDAAPLWKDCPPIEELARSHKSFTITEERRGPPR